MHSDCTLAPQVEAIYNKARAEERGSGSLQSHTSNDSYVPSAPATSASRCALRLHLCADATEAGLYTATCATK